MKILTIGGATQDVIIEHQKNSSLYLDNSSGFPRIVQKRDSTVNVETLHYASGGGAPNSAAAFRRLGFETSACFRVGNDSGGICIIEDTKRQGITTYPIIDTKAQTGVSFLLPLSQTEHSLFSYYGAASFLTQKDIAEPVIANQDCIYITSLSGLSAESLAYLTTSARHLMTKKGVRIAVHAGSAQLEKGALSLKAALPYIDVLITNAEDMKQFMSVLKPRFFQSSGRGLLPEAPSLARTVIAYKQFTFTLYEYLEEIFSHGVKKIVVNDGDSGFYVATPDALYFHPYITIQGQNFIGTDDAFGASFVAFLINGTPLEQTIRYAAINAASVYASVDAQEGLLSTKEIIKKSDYLPLVLQKYSLPIFEK